MSGIKVRPLMTSYLKELETKEYTGWLRKLLPFLLVASFMWLGLFEGYAEAVLGISTSTSSFGASLLANLVFVGLVNWLIFEVTFFIYKLILGFSIFSLSIPKYYLNNRARLFMVCRNILLGLIFNICFFVPALSAFEVLITLIVDFIMFAFFVSYVLHDKVHITVKSNVYKSLFTPFIVLQAVELFIIMLEVL